MPRRIRSTPAGRADRPIVALIMTLNLALSAPLAADAPPDGALSVTEVATADQPIYVTAPPGDTSRVFVLERGGRVRILDRASGTLATTPFLIVPGVSTSGEGGLLGLAFHPDYADNGRFVVSYTSASGGFALALVEYTVDAADPDLADPTSARPILSIAQPQTNHNGGWVGFGPDGFLYIASGDGGGADDNDAGHTPGIGNAQDATDNLLGKMLRIDVDGDDFPGDASRNYAIPPDNPFVGETGDDEIWALGLRNPWRASFDRTRGDLYIGDVGQNAREEVDVEHAGSAGGANYGWRLREGSIATPSGGVGGPPPPGNVEPLYEYLHGSGPFRGNSVTGGYVYRGPNAALDGHYFFADFSRRNLWSFEVGENGPDPATAAATVRNWNDAIHPVRDPLPRIASFGEDGSGNLYFVDLAGSVYRIDGVYNAPRAVPGLPPWAAVLAFGITAFLGWCAVVARYRV